MMPLLISELPKNWAYITVEEKKNLFGSILLMFELAKGSQTKILRYVYKQRKLLGESKIVFKTGHN